MCPNTDHTDELAECLAILQGRESLNTVTIDRLTLQSLYNIALEMNKAHFIALPSKDGYTTTKHVPTWSRRIR